MRYIPLKRISDKFRVVVNATYSNYTESDVSAVIGSIAYEARAELRMPKDFFSIYEPQLLGNVIIVDVELNLSQSNSRNVYEHTESYVERVTSRIRSTIDTEATVQFFNADPQRQVTVVLTTTATNDQIVEALSYLGEASIV